MKRSLLLCSFSQLLLIGAYNLVFFLLAGPARTQAMWAAYIAAHVSFLLLLIPSLFPVRGMARLAFRRAYLTRAFSYYLLALILDVVFLFTGTSLIVVVSVQAGLLVLFLIVSGLFSAAASDAAAQEQKTAQELGWMRGCIGELNALMLLPLTPEARRAVNAVLEDLRYSPTASDPRVFETERRIEAGISVLREHAGAADEAELLRTAAQLRTLIAGRNNSLKTLR